MEETRSEWAYYTLLEAYGRLHDRLGTGDEDPDVEIIISNLLRIQRLLCLKMFECAQQ